jgi:hypothetical protein
MPRLDRGPGYRPGRTGRECGFAASIAHEVNQPLGAVVANAGASLRLLDGQGCIISDANRAADVIACIRALTKKTPFQKQQVDLNDVVLEVAALTRTALRARPRSTRGRDPTAWLRMQSDANSSLHQPANREINREFCPIRPFTAIFVSDQRADSMAYSGIPYVTEQGISKDVSGKILSRNRESGNLRICIPASPHFLNEKLVWASLRSCGCQTTRMRRRSMNSAKTLTWKATSRRYESPIWGSRVKPTLAMGLILCCSCSRRSTSPVASWVAPQGLHSSANPLPNSAGYAIFGWQREIRHHG